MGSDVLEGGGLASTCRATAAQATIKFLKNQYVEREGVVRPFFAGCFGIFGHGNVAGIGQALQQDEDFPYYLSRNEQAMVHTAVALSKTACGRSRALLRLVRELPTWYLGCYWYREPHSCAPASGRHIRAPQRRTCSPTTRISADRRHFRQRLLQAGLPLLGPQQLLSALPEAVRVMTSCPYQ